MKIQRVLTLLFLIGCWFFVLESASTTSSSSSSSTTSVGLIKKMIFKRSKASSSGDITKNLKNGLNKMMINGIDKLNLSNNSNITSNNNVNSISKEADAASRPIVKAQPCQGQQCCGIFMKPGSAVNGNNFKYNNGHSELGYSSNSATNGLADVAETTLVNGGKLEFMDAVDGGQKSPETNRGDQTATENGTDDDGGGYDNDYYLMTTDKHVNQDYWYMCDDDKIKVMSKREFQELLMPNNKIMITPYLLFFARFNAQPTPPMAGSSASS
jgi:ubiquitin carboxyl-terminal hydrolase 1